MSFVSPEVGFVLGTAPCRHAPCSVILRTEDRGGSWVGLPAPRESVDALPGLGHGLWGLDFANARAGFAYGDGLWATTDGAARWRRVSAPASIVLDLATVDDRWVLAVASACLSETGRCPRGTPQRLYRRALTGGAWTPVASAGSVTSSLAVDGSRVWALAGERLLASTDGGARFAEVPQPCTNRPGNPEGAASVTATATPLLLCIGSPGAGSAPKYVYRRAGARWALAGTPPAGGVGGVIAPAGDGDAVVASSSGASELYRGADGARRWSTPLTLDDGGAGWASLAFVNPNDGAVVEGPASATRGSSDALGRLYLSDDAGRTWRRSRLT